MDKMQAGVKAVPVPYWIIDAFTESAFKGDPAAVCLVEEEKDGEWLQSVAKECNFPITSFLRPAPALENGVGIDANNTRFHLRWLVPVAEVKICGHGTLAAAHFLFTCGSSATNTIEFITKSGLLTAKRIDGFKQLGSASLNDEKQECFTVELDLPIIPGAQLMRSYLREGKKKVGAL